MVEEQEKADVSPNEELPPAEQPETEAEAAPVLTNLVILPPLQKSNALERDELHDAIPLPPIRAEEPVSSIRAALSEVVGYAHLTNYRFELEEPPTSKPIGKSDAVTVSPYTGPNSVVSVPAAVKSLEKEPQGVPTEKPIVLDDYGDLSSLVNSGLRDGSAFRIILERYDVASIRDHVTRLRSLLDGNAPSALTLDEGAEKKTSNESAGQATESEADVDDSKKEDASTTAPSSGEQATNEAPGKSKEDAKQISKKDKEPLEKEAPPRDMPVYPANKQAAVDTTNLKDFFYLACGEDPALYTESANSSLPRKENGSKSKKKGKKGKDKSQKDEENKEKPAIEQVMSKTIPLLNALEEKTRLQCTICFSGFHPPPPFRRLMGDLAYLDVTLPGETESIHITAVPTGFYVNRSISKNGNHKFDPSPAAKPCFSHELLDCLLQCSDSFLAEWKEALVASKERAEFMTKLNEDGPFSSLFRVAIRGDFSGYKKPTTAAASEGIDALIQNPSWLVPIPKVESIAEESWTRNCVHAFNPAKSEEDFSSSFGVDLRNGAARDWNEELQGAREMAVTTLQERIERAR